MVKYFCDRCEQLIVGPIYKVVLSINSCAEKNGDMCADCVLKIKAVFILQEKKRNENRKNLPLTNKR